jgi:prenyl protein peptidase
MLTVDIGNVSGYDAIIACTAMAACYVGSLYLCPSKEPRDHPTTVIQRSIATISVSLLAPVVLYIGYRSETGDSLLSHLGLGLSLSNQFSATLRSLSLFALLFAGPLVQETYNNTWQQRITPSSHLFWRNFVVAPITEEWIFRCCSLPLLAAAFDTTTAVWTAPLFFGLAHLHHYIGGTPLIQVLVQFTYTTVFGWMSACAFARTHSAFAPMLAHAFCNYMGLPAFASAFSSTYRGRWIVGPVYVVGLFGFIYCLATESIV